MVRHWFVQPKAAEPAIRQVQVHLLAKAALRANAERIANDQHPDHQHWINGRPACVAVEGCELTAQLAQVQEAINPPQQMVLGNVVVKAERVEQLLLRPALASHHREHPRRDWAQL